MKPPVRRVYWKRCWRIIPTRYPEKKVFERVADGKDLDVVEQLERMTNERLRHERGEIRLVKPTDRIKGPGSQYIMAAFTHLSPSGSRFSDGSFGVYYAAREFATAVEESAFHRERFMRYTKEAAARLEMRVLAAKLDGDLHDIRGMKKQLPKVYSRTSYAAGQELAGRLRKQDSYGIAYDSIRSKGGECAAVFRPPALKHCWQERHMEFEWDGKRISKKFELREYVG
ncbi:MAG: RES family NAD+ phosphorylase [Proteobacteria bacterium]|nr:RES family NAD+ phosphorylase [Pseudomonadota bacterium]